MNRQVLYLPCKELVQDFFIAWYRLAAVPPWKAKITVCDPADTAVAVSD
ncbi:hypothetical protein [Paenibacillus pinihumi]|nr:hypothetical protein [Paenibacillus pinihumi]